MTCAAATAYQRAAPLRLEPDDPDEDGQSRKQRDRDDQRRFPNRRIGHVHGSCDRQQHQHEKREGSAGRRFRSQNSPQEHLPGIVGGALSLNITRLRDATCGRSDSACHACMRSRTRRPRLRAQHRPQAGTRVARLERRGDRLVVNGRRDPSANRWTDARDAERRVRQAPRARAELVFAGFRQRRNRKSASATQAGFSCPSRSIVAATRACLPPVTSSTSSIRNRPRMRLPTGTGEVKRTRLRP